MKATDMLDKSAPELTELEKSIQDELFQSRLQNFTNQLDDTSSINKKRRDLARIKGELRRRELDELTKSVQAAMQSTASGQPAMQSATEAASATEKAAKSAEGSK